MDTPVRLAEKTLNGPAETARFAAWLGQRLRPGDTLLLEGEIGAGKTAFARALIQSLQDAPEDVPSPTFTLVQTYETRSGEIWHADLYRLSGPEDVHELGLDAALDHAICLVEWPDRLGADSPKDALTISFLMGRVESVRHVILSGAPEHWADRLEVPVNA